MVLFQGSRSIFLILPQKYWFPLFPNYAKCHKWNWHRLLTQRQSDNNGHAETDLDWVTLQGSIWKFRKNFPQVDLRFLKFRKKFPQVGRSLAWFGSCSASAADCLHCCKSQKALPTEKWWVSKDQSVYFSKSLVLYLIVDLRMSSLFSVLNPSKVLELEQFVENTDHRGKLIS